MNIPKNGKKAFRDENTNWVKKNKLENYTKYFTLTVFLSTRGYKWRIFRDAWLNTGGGNLGMDWRLIQGREDCNAPIRFMLKGNHNKLWLDGSLGLTLYTLTSVCIFSTLFIHFLRCWQGEFVCQSKSFFPGDHFLNSHDCNVWFRGDIVRRN